MDDKRKRLKIESVIPLSLSGNKNASYRRRGFTLFEMLVAVVILTIIGSAIAATYAMESTVLQHASNRLRAVRYARSCASTLMSQAMGNEIAILYGSFNGPEALSPGHHNITSDPEACRIPPSHFRQKLKGSMYYNIEKVVLSQATGEWGVENRGVLRIEIVVEWQEDIPKTASKKETLVITPAYFYEVS